MGDPSPVDDVDDVGDVGDASPLGGEQRQVTLRAFDRDGYLLAPRLLAAALTGPAGPLDTAPVTADGELLRLVEDLFRDDIGHRAAEVRPAAIGRPPAPELPADHNEGYTFPRLLVVHAHLGAPGHAVEVLTRSSAEPVQLTVRPGDALVLHGATPYRYLCPQACSWLVLEFFPALRATRFGWPGRISQGSDE